FEGDLDRPPRHEYQQVGDEESDSLKEPFAERRRPAREGVAEAAAPDATGADQDNGRVRNGAQDVGGGARPAQSLAAVALGVPRGPDDEILAVPQPRHDLGQGLFRPLASLAAGLSQIRNPYRANQPQKWIEKGIEKHPLPEQ